MSKTLVITGSSRGIGYALVQLASAAGHQVYALSRNISTIKKTNLVHPVSIDITIPKESQFQIPIKKLSKSSKR